VQHGKLTTFVLTLCLKYLTSNCKSCASLKSNKELPLSLLLLRLGVFIVMFMWTLDKFVNLGHTAAVMKKKFYLWLQEEMDLRHCFGPARQLHVILFRQYLGP
jgi:hypothetical protein